MLCSTSLRSPHTDGAVGAQQATDRLPELRLPAHVQQRDVHRGHALCLLRQRCVARKEHLYAGLDADEVPADVGALRVKRVGRAGLGGLRSRHWLAPCQSGQAPIPLLSCKRILIDQHMDASRRKVWVVYQAACHRGRRSEKAKRIEG